MEKEGKVIAIVQARMGSNRLPNKSMLDLHGYPVIEWVFRRARLAQEIDELVFAIPESKKDDQLYNCLINLGANVFRGDEFDLIGRFYNTAKNWHATDIVRICADCPFISGYEIDHLVVFFKSNNYDFAYNNVPVNNCYPDGIGAEIVSFSMLERLHKEAMDPFDREHISSYIRSRPETFNIGTFDPEDERLHHPDVRIDLDTSQDYQKLLRMNVNINMEAHQIVKAARELI